MDGWKTLLVHPNCVQMPSRPVQKLVAKGNPSEPLWLMSRCPVGLSRGSDQSFVPVAWEWHDIFCWAWRGKVMTELVTEKYFDMFLHNIKVSYDCMLLPKLQTDHPLLKNRQHRWVFPFALLTEALSNLWAVYRSTPDTAGHSWSWTPALLVFIRRRMILRSLRSPFIKEISGIQYHSLINTWDVIVNTSTNRGNKYIFNSAHC